MFNKGPPAEELLHAPVSLGWVPRWLPLCLHVSFVSLCLLAEFLWRLKAAGPLDSVWSSLGLLAETQRRIF